MTDNQMKFLAAVLLFILWAATIVAKHYWHDLDVDTFKAAIISTLMGIGVIHAKGG